MALIDYTDPNCYTFFRRIVELLASKLRWPGGFWLLSMSGFSFYGDESGSHKDPTGTFVVSGYLARDVDWANFEEQWETTLSTTPRIEHFHMRECFKLEDQFNGFTRYQADKKLNTLIDVLVPFLRSGKILEFTSFFEWGIYERAVTGPVRAVFSNPYQFLFAALQAETAKHVASIEFPAPIYFFMDDQIAKVEEDVSWQFYHCRETIPEHLVELLHGLLFRDDRISYPLQAADLIAWQRHRRELHLSEDLDGRRDFLRLNNASLGKSTLYRYREDGMQSFCRRMESRLRAKGLWQN